MNTITNDSEPSRPWLFKPGNNANPRGRPPGTDNLEVAVESGLEALIRDEGEAAAERAERSWHAHVAGRQLLDRAPVDLGRASPQFAAGVAALGE